MHDIEARIHRLYRRDRWVACLLVAVLLVTLAVVFVATSRFAASIGVRAVLGAAGLLLIAFNTAAILAMLRHNREDRTFIYTLDIKHRDEYLLYRAAGKHRGQGTP